MQKGFYIQNTKLNCESVSKIDSHFTGGFILFLKFGGRQRVESDENVDKCLKIV